MHYNRLMKKIHNGQLTWQQAMEQGECLPAKPKVEIKFSDKGIK